MTRPANMPALFVGHGSPMNIILDNGFTRSLRDLAGELPRPEAILVVSAHWLTEGIQVTGSEQPGIIYDFYGFPEELYRITYPCPGSPGIARSAGEAVKSKPVNVDASRGLDHAAWAVLIHMYPGADIPVLELSLDLRMEPRRHFDLGAELAGLRGQGVLVIGSGNLVHNLHMMEYDSDARPFPWAVEADSLIRDLLESRNHEALVNYRGLGRAMSLAAPTADHYLPLLYIAGMRSANDGLTFFHEGIQHGSVSMRSFIISGS